MLAGLCAAPRPTHAGGFFLPAHGVRGLGRGGAYVAGGDDAGAIWYNPATIAGQQGIRTLFDGALVLQNTSFQRVDSAGISYPVVRDEGKLLPIPTLAVSLPLPAWRDLWIGASVSAPMASLPAYPRPSYDACNGAPSGCLDTAAFEAPQRYSLISFDGSLLLRMDLALAWRVNRHLSVGISAQNLIGAVSVLKALSTYNGVLSSGPEDPEFDALSQVSVVDLFNPSAQIGIRYRPFRSVRLGAAVQLPFLIDAEGDVDVQIPASPLYAGSSVEGSRADVRMMFPLRVAVGAEVRPTPGLRIEASFAWENWRGTATDCPPTWSADAPDTPQPSAGDCEFLITPKDIYLIDIPAVPRYKVPPLGERLGYRDALSVKIGAEYFFSSIPLGLRAGYAYERGAVPTPSRSVIAFDANKHLIAAGASVALWGLRVDGVYARVLMEDGIVHPQQSTARQLNPIGPSLATRVGGGVYRSSAHLLGLGVHKAF